MSPLRDQRKERLEIGMEFYQRLDNLTEQDVEYIESVHTALMKQGKDISLSHVLDYIEQDENRPRDYARYEVKAIKEHLANLEG